MKTATILAVAAIAFAGAAVGAEPLQVEGSATARQALQPHVERIKAANAIDLQVIPVGTGQAMLDLLDGKTDTVVIAMPLADAVGAAREAAWAEGRMLKVPALAYHPIEGVEGAAFVRLADR
jgi:hypothetical protein